MSNYEIVPAADGIALLREPPGGLAIADSFEALDFEFEESVDKASRSDCAVAAGSGLMTGLLSVLLGKPLSLKDAKEIGAKEADKLVVGVARSLGCKLPEDKEIFAGGRCDGDVLAKAIRFLEGKFPIPQDMLTPEFGGGLQHHLRDFSHHPTVLGLFFSILGQFTLEGYGTDTSGAFIRVAFPAGAPTGANVHEKIAMGTINWVFHLVSDIDGSSANAGRGTGIPGPVLSLLKELSSTPLFQNVKLHYKEEEISFSKWAAKLFNGTYFRDEEGKVIRFDFRAEMGFAAQLAEESLYVLANEVVVRVFFMVSRLLAEVRDKGVTSFQDLDMVDTRAFLPVNNRALTRMCTVASGTFVAVNAAGSAIKAAMTSKGDKKAFARAFFLNVNYPGIGRFAVACFFDASYAKDDLTTAYRRAMAEREEARRRRETALEGLSAKYRFLTLGPEQARLLYSFESMLVSYDIKNTKKPERAAWKARWRREWEANVSESLGVDCDEYFIRSGRQAFDLMEGVSAGCEDRSWIDLLALELTQFVPYSPLGIEGDREFKKLRCESDYLSEVFCQGQAYIDKKSLKALQKACNSAGGTVSGGKKKAAAATAVTLAAAAATAGGALVLAPQIAALVAGEAVAGLSGAALTSASLAFVGGGSLAVGGMGMAGGTAIITGGGALLGLAGSGVTTAASVALQTSGAFVQHECSKLLAFCTEVAVRRYGRYDIALAAADGIAGCAAELEAGLDELPRAEEKPDRKVVFGMKKSLKCMLHCEKALRKLVL